YERSIKSLTDLEIEFLFAISYEDALKQFQEFNPDVIFIDIKLSSGDVNNTKGNDLFNFISNYKSSKIIRIITSNPSDIESDIEDLKNNTLFKIYTRTDLLFVDIIKETYILFNSSIYSFINNDGDELSKKIRSIYYSQIDSLICDKEIKNGLDKSRLFRYIAANLYEHFSVNETGFDEVYDWEMFFCPPLLDFVFTGDIIKKKSLDEYFIVMTPSCDLVPREDGKPKVTECLLAELNIVNLRGHVTSDKYFTRKGKDIIKNNINTYSHFIPEIKSHGPFNINFNKSQRIKISEINTDYNRIATISPLFMKEILYRFSMYSSRQGQPDLDTKHLAIKYSEESS
ncbi:MAG: response regulator, partial [Candidatus Aenigmarchaeota archaeon]|nr:response regulator [Candidatus Aenigmarchaeota archaeon]